MLDRLKQLLMDTPDDRDRDEHDIQLAAAALLVEVARADHAQDASEDAAMAALLARSLKLEADEIDALLERANTAVEGSTSLFEFTRRINDHYSPEEKRRLVLAMWQVAYADQSLDKYEEHIIRRVAELIYLPHAEFIQAKHEAMQD